jgi:hypothetical protein
MAVEGYGVTVEHGAGPTALTGVIEVTPPTMETADIDTSHMETSNRVKTFTPGWITPGEATIRLHHAPTQTQALRALQTARTVETWLITWVDGSSDTGSAYVKRVGIPTEREGLVTVDVVIKLSGAWTFDDGVA